MFIGVPCDSRFGNSIAFCPAYLQKEGSPELETVATPQNLDGIGSALFE
jgi:hypothetical protein